MRPFVPVLVVCGMLAAPAAVAEPRPDNGYVASPWFMREPAIASIGYVRTEIQANRATLAARFDAIHADPAKATDAAAARVRDLSEALRRIGGDKVRVETTFEVTPLYDQYRDKDGQLVENRRADKVDRYQVSADLEIEIRDTALVQQIYSIVVAAKPTRTEEPDFTLVADNETKTRLYEEAVKDAARRARLASAAAGAQLGPVKVIDPTGRACETDVLVLRQARGGDGVMATEVPAAVVTGSRIVRQDFEAISPVTTVGSEQLELTATQTVDTLLKEATAMRLTIQPPLQELTAKACVVYGLN